MLLSVSGSGINLMISRSLRYKMAILHVNPDLFQLVILVGWNLTSIVVRLINPGSAGDFLFVRCLSGVV